MCLQKIIDSIEAPGYAVDAGKRSSATFSAANGEPIENRGQMTLSLLTTEGHPVQSVFQACEVSRPLWSVSKICDSGCSVTFDDKGAVVKHKATGKELCVFERKRGLYTASLPLGNPASRKVTPPSGKGFTRQGGK